MPLTKENSIDYWGTHNPKCPHCDAEIDIEEWDLDFLHSEGEHLMQCPLCEKKLTVISTPFSWCFATTF